MKQLMDGMTVDHTYSGDLHFTVSFRDGPASYRAVRNTGNSAKRMTTLSMNRGKSGR